MRRATTLVPTRDGGATGSRRQDRQEERIRALEEAFALEQQRRDELEKKYTRLKRRYLRLEMAHALLQATAKSPGSTTRNRQLNGTPASPPLSSHGRILTPPPNHEEAKSATTTAGVIDLTSPTGSRRSSLATDAASMRNSQQAMSSDDFCAESPASPAVSTAFSNVSQRVARVLSRRPNSDPLPPPPPPPSNGPPGASGSRRRQLEFYTPDPSSRPRPRPLSNPSSPDEASESARSTSRRRTRSPETSPPVRIERPTPSAVQSAAPTGAAASVASTDDSDEAASIALAQYLQQQENLAALQEYQEHLQARELAQELERQQQLQHHHDHHPNQHHGAGGGGVDPDSMTYEELLQLGEENGDVKKERWRQVAVQVLSSLPTHRWTTQSSDDISCIICQYGFSVGDVALTLPCAHVFHEECVAGWVRENNSCPLCKLAIADV